MLLDIEKYYFLSFTGACCFCCFELLHAAREISHKEQLCCLGAMI
jgi:hypothetical protein